MRYTFTLVVAILALTFISAFSALAEEGKLRVQVIDGWIHAVDLKAGSFVLGGKNESQTTIRVGVKAGEREANIFLDGKRTNPAAAIESGRKASVTCVKVGDDLWASKVEVTSAASARVAEEEMVKPLIVDGWIHAVDLKAGSFVLGGKNESQTTIRVGVKAGQREANILLDGKRTNPVAAIKSGRKASVTCVKVGDDLWASKLEVTSAAK